MPERTDVDRLKHRDYMRARRAGKLAEVTRDLDFELFCCDAGLNPSPQSSLNPAFWHTAVSQYEGLDLTRSMRGGKKFGDRSSFAKAA